MRPSVDVPDDRQYECLDCGDRFVDPSTDLCECGGELRNLNRSRDL